jgi:uncharacterized protein YxjI
VSEDRFSADRYQVEQLIRPIVNLYRISADGRAVAFVRQKRMAIKEDIRFFADEDERDELFRIKARSMFEVGGRYDVRGASDERIGVLEKVFGRSLFRSTWRVLDANEAELAFVQERSLPLALLRRLLDVLPYTDLVPIVFHFTITKDGRELGEFTRRWGVRDRYELDLTGDSERTIDRRLALALAIALDALQSR